MSRQAVLSVNSLAPNVKHCVKWALKFALAPCALAAFSSEMASASNFRRRPVGYNNYCNNTESESFDHPFKRVAVLLPVGKKGNSSMHCKLARAGAGRNRHGSRSGSAW